MDNGASNGGLGGNELTDEAAIYQHLKLKKKVLSAVEAFEMYFYDWQPAD